MSTEVTVTVLGEHDWAYTVEESPRAINAVEKMACIVEEIENGRGVAVVT